MPPGPKHHGADHIKKAASGPDYGPAFQSVANGFDGTDVEAGPRSPGSTSKPLLHSPPRGHQQQQQQQHLHSSGPGRPGSRARERGSCGASRAAVLAGTLYSVSSAALTLLNKKVLVAYTHQFHAVHALLFFHCALAVGLAAAASAAGAGRIEPLSWPLLRLWMPVNVIFVAMLATNFYALQLVGVGMVSLLKNVANLFILAGDYALFGRSYSWHVWLVLALMVGSVLAGGATDAAFSWAGYGWQMANNVATAGYALYLSRVTQAVTSHTAEQRPLGQLSMVYYNNLLSLPLTAALAVARGELVGFWDQGALYSRSFQALAVLSGLFGFGISFSSIWFVSLTTATYYSLVGSFNKVVVAVLGIWWFGEPTAPSNLASIGAGLLAGGLLPLVKMRAARGGAGGAGGGGGGGGALGAK